MPKKQVERYGRLLTELGKLGFTTADVWNLLRAERVLRRWAEEECNGTIQRAGENADGKPYRNPPGFHHPAGYFIPDREAGAIRRVRAICAAHGVDFYHQGDPRGCALYVIRPGDVPEGGTVESCYTNGVAVCVD